MDWVSAQESRCSHQMDGSDRQGWMDRGSLRAGGAMCQLGDVFLPGEGERVSECRQGRGLHLGRQDGIQALRGSQLCEGRV